MKTENIKMAIFLQVAVLVIFISSAVGFNNANNNNHDGRHHHVCEQNPCQNGGSCTTNNNHGHECTCVTGFFGYDCEYEGQHHHNCDNYPCQNGCTPTYHRHGCTCDCESGSNQAITQTQQPTPAPTTSQPTTAIPTTSTTTTTTTQRPTTTPLTTPTPTTSQPPTTRTTTAAVSLHHVICGKLSTVSEVANQVTMQHASAVQCASGNQTSPEAFTLSNCNLAVPAFWKQGLNVMQNCLTVPKYSPIAVFEATGYVSSPQTISGVFLGCTTTHDGLKIAEQKCDSFPDIHTLMVGGTVDLDAFHVVVY